MSEITARRRSAFDNLPPLVIEGIVSVTPAPAASRFSFRGDAPAADLCGQAFGVPLPTQLLRASTQGDRTAMSLGPDEWLLIGPDGLELSLMAAVSSALTSHHHSLVDISHRNTAFIVSGRKAEALLGSGCLLDLHLSAFPVGMATRTIFSKADIVLHRTGVDSFHIEIWRSFVPFVWGILTEAAQDLG